MLYVEQQTVGGIFLIKVSYQLFKGEHVHLLQLGFVRQHNVAAYAVHKFLGDGLDGIDHRFVDTVDLFAQHTAEYSEDHFFLI